MEGIPAAARYREACRLLPPRLQQAALAVPARDQEQAEELRLRAGQPVHLSLPGGERALPGAAVGREELEQVLDRATDYSRYTAEDTLAQGYVTAPGGFRVGVCGTALPHGMRDVSSLAIRIPRPCTGLAAPLLPRLTEEGALVSTLLLSPPGGGKTTLLRDLVRLVSDGAPPLPPLRVALVDERGELAAMHQGRPQLAVGCRTDVLEGCSKERAVPMLLQSMAPQVIALDELALDRDVEAVRRAAGCGAVLLATAHASSVAGLSRRPALAGALECGVFRRAVVISGRGGERRYQVEDLP